MTTLPTEPFLVARLPLPPSVNALYRTIPWTTAQGKHTSRRVITAEYAAFIKEAIPCLEKAEIQDWTAIEYIREEKRKRRFVPLKMEVICHLGHLWTSDLDNRMKALQDITLTNFLQLSDILITELVAKKRLGMPGCQVRLSFAQDGGEG